MPTIFEREWDNPETHIFKSERHGVMAVVDTFAKLPFQLVIAPRFGNKIKEAHFFDLPLITRRKLHELSDVVGQKILDHCAPNQRVITHTEGFGVSDHAHIVMFAAERGQGKDLYVGDPLGTLAVQRTIELIRFTPIEVELAEARLDQII